MLPLYRILFYAPLFRWIETHSQILCYPVARPVAPGSLFFPKRDRSTNFSLTRRTITKKNIISPPSNARCKLSLEAQTSLHTRREERKMRPRRRRKDGKKRGGKPDSFFVYLSPCSSPLAAASTGDISTSAAEPPAEGGGGGSRGLLAPLAASPAAAAATGAEAAATLVHVRPLPRSSIKGDHNNNV